jgi:hypothetical protein
MSDRASIWLQQPNPQLSITNILGCVSGDGSEGPTVAGAAMYSPATAGCAGGLPMGAVEMFANYGDVTSSCVGYEWCTNDPVCGAKQRLGFSEAPAYLNSIIPACADMLKSCVACKDGTCTTTSSRRELANLKTYPSGRPYIILTDILSMQQEIAAHGPIVATYAIYADFQNGTAALVGDGWAKTRGVYCNVQTTTGRPRPYNGTRYAGTEDQMVGYHAVIIVGWGVERDVPDWERPGSTFDLPYWIVRNSWSEAWNPECQVNGIAMPGYFKIAFTDPIRNINTKVYLDNTSDGLVGAAIAFMPQVTRVTPAQSGISLIDEHPVMIEESIDVSPNAQPTMPGSAQPTMPGSAQPTMPGTAAATQTYIEPDVDESRRYEINQPIMCATDDSDVNCEHHAARLAATRFLPMSAPLLPVLVLLVCTTVIVAVVAIIVIRRSATSK